jgi:hypothetical protein
MTNTGAYGRGNWRTDNGRSWRAAASLPADNPRMMRDAAEKVHDVTLTIGGYGK